LKDICPSIGTFFWKKFQALDTITPDTGKGFAMIDMQMMESGYAAVEKIWPEARPRFALTLGSGWSEVVDSMDLVDSIEYDDIPGLGAAGVIGHAGRLLLCRSGAGGLLIFQGRRHRYEGVGWEPIAMPVYIAKRMGVESILLTNAAGGCDEDMQAGDLMLVSDHINMLGANPLTGPHDEFWGPRFPDQSEIYDKALGEHIAKAGEQAGIRMHRGVYLAASGPTFETPAEVRAFQTLGADAVGMSTVPEAMLAAAAGMSVAAVSLISNLAAGISPTPLTHQEVIEVSSRALPRLSRLFQILFSGELE